MDSLFVAVVDELPAAEALSAEWAELAQTGGDYARFRGPEWALSWLAAYGAVFEASLCMIAVREAGGRLVGLAPFYARMARVAPTVKVRELRLLGDAGPRPPMLDLLVVPGYEERFAKTLVEWLTGAGAEAWDIIDLQPLRDPSRARAYMAEGLDGAGRKVECYEAGTYLSIALASADESDVAMAVGGSALHVYGQGGEALGELGVGLATLRRLSRLEWSAREEASPISDQESAQMLTRIAHALGPNAVRLCVFHDERGEASAAVLIVDDPPRAACVALALRPEGEKGLLTVHAASAKLLFTEACAARKRGLRTLDVVVGAGEIEPPPLPVSVRRSLRLRAFNSTTVGILGRTFSSFRRHAELAIDARGAAAAGARATWARIRDAATQVAAFQRLHLYRGELWISGIVIPEGLTVSELTVGAFESLDQVARGTLLERLELEEDYCRDKWRRGDLVVLARFEDRPAGIAWCARSAVYVPEIGRDVRPGASECYIHDVFVAPDARGRNVAPVMLEDLARRLRQRDVYRAWALIHPENAASTRAFEKAAYASVGDVIYARMAAVDKLVLRPPDAEGKKILGIG